ncbi:nucleotidyltransferase (plasmid) [Sutcliffiella horikoshii]|uniref:nucleotidyltransferase domain-containing protein n=1 Tax=Sutcliffiella horikoshii TaxID=79883 RepID=UPI001CBE78E8|nr:nucleotidyltransferase [Sutcliffiella horikoshii]UAL49801.1 nucleotidyltransferase [Sutcliffiella horikoshii]
MFDNFNNQLDDLLQRVGQKLQISKSQRELAENRYLSVGTWLSKDETYFKGKDVLIYPQGSLSINTTVKPRKQQEYDLDLVCEINESWQGKDPIKLLDSIERRLREHETYKKMVERKNRCIRLNYANEFHMDILPAHPTDKGNNTNVKVPDRKAEDWKDSNPKGYAQWFNDQLEQYWHVLMEKKAASIQPLPIDEDLNRKPPLKRAVQLIKRYRDIYFEDDLEFAPISIVLTTFAGMYYNGEVSVNEAIDGILEKVILNIPQDGRLKVFNPTNKEEELSERWEGRPDLYEKFLDFIRDFKQHWNKLNKLEGIKDVATELKLMFGETIIEESLKEQAELVEKNRTANTLFIASSGVLVAASKENTVQVRTNTFYGQ